MMSVEYRQRLKMRGVLSFLMTVDEIFYEGRKTSRMDQENSTQPQYPNRTTWWWWWWLCPASVTPKKKAHKQITTTNKENVNIRQRYFYTRILRDKKSLLIELNCDFWDMIIKLFSFLCVKHFSLEISRTFCVLGFCVYMKNVSVIVAVATSSIIATLDYHHSNSLDFKWGR